MTEIMKRIILRRETRPRARLSLRYCGQEEAGIHFSEIFSCFKQLSEISDHFLPPEEHSLATATEKGNGKILRGRFIMITFTVIL